MECVVIGSHARCIYGDDDRIENASDYGTKSVIYCAAFQEPGNFGKNILVAVKKFRLDSSTTEAIQVTNSDLLTRWSNMTKLRHKNVVSYHKIAIQWMHPESDSGRRFIQMDFVMDYCDGADLSTMLREMRKAKRTLHVKTLLEFSKQMANGLAYLHKNNIIHGDLKLSSVLVTQSSMHHFCLRLCGLDSFTSSYAAFVKQRYLCQGFVAPEVLTIIREGASLVVHDPFFSIMHILQKRIAGENVPFGGVDGVSAASDVIERIIDIYNVHRTLLSDKEDIHSPFGHFREYLDNRISFFLSRDESTEPRKQLSLEILNFLHRNCFLDSAQLQKISEVLAKDDMDNSYAQCEAPVVTLDTVMSVFVQHVRAHTTASPETGSSLESRKLCLPHESVLVDGRKADIWSLGKIMDELAERTFDNLQKARTYASLSSTDLRDLNNQMRKADEDEDYKSYLMWYIPIDFRMIVHSCCNRLAAERLTAEELTNKLVALEEHTYGSTWVNNPQDGVTDAEQFDYHRQMLEEIGCTCAYDYCFWRDFIGQGAYGNVYTAKVTKAGTYKGNETVVVKQVILNNIRIKQKKQDGSWEKAKEQWQKLLKLTHAHLVTYHKVTLWKLIQGAGIEFLMDYCQGGDLDALIMQCKTGICTLSAEAVVNCATQLTQGLCYLHENQFIHGDLKPGNVFMDRPTDDTGNRTLRIGDLDGAVQIRDNCARTERRDLAGTGPYMSPEMIMQLYEKEHAEVGFPTDIWSLGCVVLDLANCSVGVRERLFYKTVTDAEGITEIHKIDRQSFSADQFLFQLSQGYHPLVSVVIRQDIKDIIQRCLEPDCENRSTAALVLEQLMRDANGDLDN